MHGRDVMCSKRFWSNSSIPPSVSRPWWVFEDDLEDRLAVASQGSVAGRSVKHCLAAVQARGARAVFRELSEAWQRAYTKGSRIELLAYWRWQAG